MKSGIELSDVTNAVAEIRSVLEWIRMFLHCRLRKKFWSDRSTFLTQLNLLVGLALAETYWSYDDVSIVLFTGQTTYSEQLRNLVVEYVGSKMKERRICL